MLDATLALTMLYDSRRLPAGMLVAHRHLESKDSTKNTGSTTDLVPTQMLGARSDAPVPPGSVPGS